MRLFASQNGKKNYITTITYSQPFKCAYLWVQQEAEDKIRQV
uniref:Uncharacterized protein n=1 Tax=Anguilla anguilla TaxID=7936 RepID=A0A0E9Q377_ANGAN